ncbi:MAG: tryptophan transporter [Finegoldia sp.]|nr:tryptophan transporter [Finegoldia sp.]
MDSKNLTKSAILIAVGAVLHTIVPPIFLGVKPDFLLSMAFLAIMISKDIKTTLIIGSVAGIISAMTTGFPGGQVPNFIEKIITSLIVFSMIKAMNFQYSNLKVILINVVGTIVSGCLFLLFALAITGQLNLFAESLPVVLIAAPINAILGLVVYKAFEKSKLIK